MLDVALPAVVLRAVPRLAFDLSVVGAALMPWIVFALAGALLWPLGRALGWSTRTRGALILTAGLGNTSFVGFPMVEALMGPEHLPVAVVVDQLGSFFVLSLPGIALAFAWSGGAASPPELLRRIVRFPPFVALVAGLFVLSFPYQRWHDTFPTEKFVENARAQADEERAQSLEFRFLNEEMLLERVKMRPIVGWGEFGRANVYDTFSGRRITVRDGAWIIQFGDRGLLGLVWMFGMLVLPLIASVFAAARARKEHRRSIAALAVLLAIGAIDLLPNGAFHPLAFTFAGAMLGQLAALGARVKVPVRVRRARRSAALVPA